MEDRQNQESSRMRISTSAAIASGIAIAAILAGGGTGIWAWQKLTSSTPPAVEREAAAPDTAVAGGESEAVSASPSAAAPEADEATPAAAATTDEPTAQSASEAAVAAPPQAYWLGTSSEALELVAADVELNAKAATNPEAALEVAFDRLLAGPRQDDTQMTAIPTGTRLRKVSIRADGVHVDLSRDFTTGGGTFSMAGRVAQVLHTASSLDPDAPVWLDVDGEPLEVLGGEGLILDRPLTRRGFANDFQL